MKILRAECHKKSKIFCKLQFNKKGKTKKWKTLEQQITVCKQ